MFKFLYQCAYGHLKSGFLAAVLALLGVTLSYLFPLLTKYIIDIILKQGLIDKLVQISLVLILLYIISSFINFWSAYLTRLFRERTAQAIKLKIFSHLLYIKFTHFQQMNLGDITSRIILDVENLKSVMLDTFILMVKNILVVLIGLGIMLYLSRFLTLLILPFLPLIYIISHQRSKKIGKLSEDIQKNVGRITSSVIQPLYNFFLVKCYLMEKEAIKKLNSTLEKYIENSLKYGIESALASELISFFHSFAGILLFFGGGLLIIKNYITLGTLVAATYLFSQIFSGVTALANFKLGIQTAYASYKRIKEILQLELEDTNGHFRLTTSSINLEFKNVQFSYYEAKEILKNITFKINKGNKVALVGPSGSGKSTIIRLLGKFFLPNNGEIRINDEIINNISTKSIRENIAFIPQEDFLFDGTIEENIKVGKLDATPYELDQAIDLANLKNFIENQPQGIYTSLGERGLNISGGERQRISIARAFLKDSPVIVFDEAISQLDAESEHKIRAALMKLFKEKTVIIIAHRLSTVVEADKIFVLNNGKIIAQGTHSDLYNRCTFYRKLCDIQFIKETK